MEVARRWITDCRPVYVPWRRDLERPLLGKGPSWDAHIAKVIGTGKAHVGKMDVILADSHLDTRITIYIMIDVIVPKLEYAEVWEGSAKLVEQLETVQMTAATLQKC